LLYPGFIASLTLNQYPCIHLFQPSCEDKPHNHAEGGGKFSVLLVCQPAGQPVGYTAPLIDMVPPPKKKKKKKLIKKPFGFILFLLTGC
jgi:hypothetical protein